MSFKNDAVGGEMGVVALHLRSVGMEIRRCVCRSTVAFILAACHGAGRFSSD